MKIGKRVVISSAVVTSAIAFSTAAMAYIPGDYCGRLSRNWTGSFGDWANWIAMCI